MARPTDILKLMAEITKIPSFEKRVELFSQRDGYSALFRAKDGNAYEVVIRPAGETTHPSLKKKTAKKKGKKLESFSEAIKNRKI